MPVIQPASALVMRQSAMKPGRSAGHVYAPIWAHTCAAHTQVTRRAGLRVARAGSGSSWILQPRRQAGLDLIADTAEYSESLRLIASGARRILEGPVEPLHRARHDGASLVGVVAHGDDAVPTFRPNVLVALRSVPRNIDADFCHGPDGQRMHGGLLRACAPSLQPIAGHGTQPPLGYLAPSRVVCAEEEHPSPGHS